jgi:hypothetical protein
VVVFVIERQELLILRGVLKTKILKGKAASEKIENLAEIPMGMVPPDFDYQLSFQKIQIRLLGV